MSSTVTTLRVFVNVRGWGCQRQKHRRHTVEMSTRWWHKDDCDWRSCRCVSTLSIKPALWLLRTQSLRSKWSLLINTHILLTRWMQRDAEIIRRSVKTTAKFYPSYTKVTTDSGSRSHRRRRREGQGHFPSPQIIREKGIIREIWYKIRALRFFIHNYMSCPLKVEWAATATVEAAGHES